MPFEDKTLYLLKSYEFDVLIEENNNRFAGKLTLSPKNIVFRVVGEEYGERKFNTMWEDKEYLICKDTNKTFVLFNLRVITVQGRILGRHHTDIINFFECSYSVEYLIHFPIDILDYLSITGMRIHSPTIAHWIGNTTTQKRINDRYLANFKNRTKPFDKQEELFEFKVNIFDKIFFGIY